MFHRNGCFLDALSSLPLTVVGISSAVPAADRLVGPVTSDAVTRTAGDSSTVKAHSIVLTFILTFV